MPKETGGTLCETQGNLRGNGWKHVGNCCLRGFLGHLFTSFQVASHIDGTTHQSIKKCVERHYNRKLNVLLYFSSKTEKG